MNAALTALRATQTNRHRLDDREYRLITQARDEGTTWREIATALGIDSPQAAAQRHQRLAARIRPMQLTGSG